MQIQRVALPEFAAIPHAARFAPAQHSVTRAADFTGMLYALTPEFEPPPPLPVARASICLWSEHVTPFRRCMMTRGCMSALKFRIFSFQQRVCLRCAASRLEAATTAALGQRNAPGQRKAPGGRGQRKAPATRRETAHGAIRRREIAHGAGR
eukprot:2177599-Pleurochrysis_carterae.AAC.1